MTLGGKFQISPYFRYFNTFPPYFDKIILSPTFKNAPLFSANLRVFLHTLCVFRPPYFYHHSFIHHTMHVLDAPAILCERASAYGNSFRTMRNCSKLSSSDLETETTC